MSSAHLCYFFHIHCSTDIESKILNIKISINDIYGTSNTLLRYWSGIFAGRKYFGSTWLLMPTESNIFQLFVNFPTSRSSLVTTSSHCTIHSFLSTSTWKRYFIILLAYLYTCYGLALTVAVRFWYTSHRVANFWLFRYCSFSQLCLQKRLT